MAGLAAMSHPSDPYVETLSVPAGWWLGGVAFVAAVGWCFLLATPLLVTGVATAVTAAIVLVGLSRYGGVRVATDPDGFSAGRALLPYGHVGAVQPLGAAATRRILGTDADARAYLLVRAYCGGSVKVMVDDPADPTPYWVVSTRRPQALAESLVSRSVRD
jgi:DUF3093 family protein